ncbi:hypothetical protein [uncultured Cohaesibacter sp.]|uniref:hypothetical protein n=1 Tax=uncultured Cohaesibacter sp. TaxID=1002546 RepID=UPI0029C8BED7|nr:hypothetical protein [uncultured Cohaesibacter sp.]
MAEISDTPDVSLGEEGEINEGLEEALAHARLRVAEDPISIIFRSDLMEILNVIAARHQKNGALIKALKAVEEALKNCEELLTLHKTQVETRRQQGQYYQQIGALKQALEDDTGALVAYGECVAICERMVATEAQERLYKYDLARAKWCLAEIDSKNRKRLLSGALDFLLNEQKDGMLEQDHAWMIEAIRKQLKDQHAPDSAWEKIRAFFL